MSVNPDKHGKSSIRSIPASLMMGILLLLCFVTFFANSTIEAKGNKGKTVKSNQLSMITEEAKKALGDSFQYAAVVKVNGKIIPIICFQEDANQANGSIKTDILSKAKILYKRVFSNKKLSYQCVDISVTMVKTNANGDTEEVTVVRMEMSKEKAKRIKWNEFKAERIPAVCDDYWEDPSLNK